MKQNFIQEQYVQLAREQFCQIMKTVPFVSDIEIIRTGLQRGFGEFHAIVHYEDCEETQRFCVDVKSNGERRFVNAFMRMASQYHDGACYVFMAPYVSESSEVSIREGGYSYIDLSGNCYIRSKRIFIHFKGNENKYIEKKEKKNYFGKASKAASTVFRTMLNDKNHSWQVKTLADESGKAIGTVANVKSFLKDRDWLEETARGEFRLKHIKEMLYTWAKDYHKKDDRKLEFYSLDSVAQIEQRISAWSFQHDKSALLSGFSAAARYAPTVRYQKVETYVEQQVLQEFILDLNLESVSSGGNVIVTIPHDETPYMFYRELNNSLVTSPAQTILDLLGNAGRGEEAADAIILKEYKE